MSTSSLKIEFCARTFRPACASTNLVQPDSVAEDVTDSEILKAGSGHAFFLRRDVAAQLQLPSRRMLRERVRRRIKANRKKKWAEYRQAKETALGKPMRRVRANCRHADDGSK